MFAIYVREREGKLGIFNLVVWRRHFHRRIQIWLPRVLFSDLKDYRYCIEKSNLLFLMKFGQDEMERIK